MNFWTTRNIILAVLAVILAGGALFLAYRGEEENVSDEALRPAPEFNLLDYDGREVKLADFRGKNLILNSWAAWCPFCVDELPDFAALQQEFGDKIAVIAIDRGESLAVAKSFSDRVGATGKMIFLLDPSDSFYQSIGGFSMPETIFVDKDGFIKYHKRGPMKLEEIRRRTQEVFGF